VPEYSSIVVTVNTLAGSVFTQTTAESFALSDLDAAIAAIWERIAQGEILTLDVEQPYQATGVRVRLNPDAVESIRGEGFGPPQ
jgi:hypothetical protein